MKKFVNSLNLEGGAVFALGHQAMLTWHPGCKRAGDNDGTMVWGRCGGICAIPKSVEGRSTIGHAFREEGLQFDGRPHCVIP